MRAAALLLIASCGSEIDPLSFPDLLGGSGLKPPDVDLPEAPLAPDIAALEAWADAPPAVALPMLTPCPAGWTEVGGEVPHCDPWPNGRAACSGASAHFPGEAGCREVGSACPAGLFAEVGGAKLYVLPGAVGGDGSLALPFGTIAAAIQAATATTVLLGKGRFEEAITIDRDLTLVGACAAETIIAGVTAETPTVEVTGSRVELRDLQVLGPGEGVRFESVPAGAVLSLNGVLISGTNDHAIAAFASGTMLEARDLIVREVQNTGIAVAGGAHAELRATSVQRVRGNGLSVFQAGEVTLLDSVVADTRFTLDGQNGFGAFVYADAAGAGGRLRLERSVVEGSALINVFVYLAGARIDAIGSVIRGSVTGLRAERGGAFAVSRSFFEKHQREAIGISGDGDATIDHVLAIENGRLPLSEAGHFGAIHVVDGAAQISNLAVFDSGDVGLTVRGTRVNATNVTIRDSAYNGLTVYADSATRETLLTLSNASIARGKGGLFVFGPNASAALDEVRIAENADPRGNGGSAIYLDGGSHVTGARVLAERNQGWAVSVHEASSLVLAEVVVRDTEGTPGDANSGRALNAFGANIEIAGALFERNSSITMQAEVQGSIAIENAIIRDTQSDPISKVYGIAATALDRGSLAFTRVRVERSRGVAFAVDGMDSLLQLTDVAVVDTLSDEVHGRFAYALQVSDSAIARVDKVELTHCRGFGVLVEDAVLEGSDLAIIDTESTERTQEYGGGMYAYAGARVDLRSVLVESSHHVAISGADAGTQIDMVDLTVRATRPAGCATFTCRNGGVGSALAVQEGAAMRVEKFSLTNNSLAGLHILTGASLDAKDGEISDNAVGADIEIEDYDLHRISEGVFYYGNVRDLQSITLPIPRPDARVGLPGT